MRHAILLSLCLALTASCASTNRPQLSTLGQAEAANDFDSYEVHRVGLLPLAGRGEGDFAETLEASLAAEFARSTPYELVRLDERDLEEIEASDPYRKGFYSPRTIISLAQRYNLDAILFGTITDRQSWTPQRVGLSMDMVSAETGLVLWTARLNLDASDPRVIEGMQAYYGEDESSPTSGTWQIALLSPDRFARFAAVQAALLL